jgi:Flp pilus assembly protein TadG
MVERAPRLEEEIALELSAGPSRPRLHVRRLLRSERGTAVVEFALVAVPLFLIVLGILDFGRALNYYNDLTQLAGQGARAAAVNQNVNGTPANGSFQQMLAAEADSPELKSSSNHLNVCVTSVPTAVGSPVTVTATYSFHFIPLVHPVAITLSASQTERSETATPGYSATCSGP